MNRDIVKGFWTLLAGGAFYIHLTARTHDKLDEDGLFPREVRVVKAQCACVNEDKPDDPNREFLLKHVCTVLCPNKLVMRVWLAHLLASLVLDTLVLQLQFKRVQ